MLYDVVQQKFRNLRNILTRLLVIQFSEFRDF